MTCHAKRVLLTDRAPEAQVPSWIEYSKSSAERDIGKLDGTNSWKGVMTIPIQLDITDLATARRRKSDPDKEGPHSQEGQKYSRKQEPLCRKFQGQGKDRNRL